MARKQSSGSRKDRKHGRNKKKCARYKAEGRREINKKRKQK